MNLPSTHDKKKMRSKNYCGLWEYGEVETKIPTTKCKHVWKSGVSAEQYNPFRTYSGMSQVAISTCQEA